MAYEVNFGSLRVGGTKPNVKRAGRFRLAVLGDFSARANRGKLETGAALAARKPLRVDCDNLDATLQRLNVKLNLMLGADGASPLEFAVSSLDDLHPDQLYQKLPVFSELAGLRQRLKTPATFAKAAAEVQSWGDVKFAPQRRERARSAVVPVNAKLSDFARLVGTRAAPPKPAVNLTQLLKQIVGPYVVPAKDPKQDALVATVDSALAGTMRSVLHHPDFQSFEALWRSVDLLVRRLETDEQLQIVLVDVTAEELAADLSQADALENSGLYQMLVEQPALDANQGPFAALVASYLFEQTPPHAELLGRVARIVAQTQTSFLAAVGTSCFETKPMDLHPLVRESWEALAKMPEAGYLGLVTPRFMLRMPYGERTDPIESFDFEEFTPRAGLTGMLWGNSAVIAGLLLAETFRQEGAEMKLGSTLGVGEMPFYCYEDADGDQTALPCTERMLSVRMAEHVGKHRFMALLSMKGNPEVRLAGFRSLTGGPLAGFWQPATGSSPPSVSSAPAAPKSAANEAQGAKVETAEPEKSPEATEPAAATPAPSESAESAAAPTVDPELDKLLASLSEETAPTVPPAETAVEENAEPTIDPELAQLLKDLG